MNRRIGMLATLITLLLASTLRADDFVVIQAEDANVCHSEGRVETHLYPRSVGRKMVMLYPGSRITATTELNNISIVLPPVFEAPGPRYGNFLKCRLRVRIDDLPWRELALATARSETILAEDLGPGKHTIAVEPIGGVAVVDAFRTSRQPFAGLTGTILAEDYSELLTDVRADVFEGDRLVRTELVRHLRSGAFEILGMPAGQYRLRLRAAGWLETTVSDLKILKAGHRVDVGLVLLSRDPRCGGQEAHNRPGPCFGHTLSVQPGDTLTLPVSLPGAALRGARLRSQFKSFDLVPRDVRKLPIGRWNDVGTMTVSLPREIPFDMYDLVLSFETKQGEVLRESGQALCVRPPLPEAFRVAGCGHMNTWGQETAEYLGRVAAVAELAGARTLLIANEVNAAYLAGTLTDLRIPYVATRGNHTMARWDEFFGVSSRAHDDGPMRIVEFGRWPYESWEEVHALFRARPRATNRVMVCYEGFAPVSLLRDQEIDLLFDAHSDDPHPERAAFPPGYLQLRAPTQDTLRWIPMTHQGVAGSVKSREDVPVLKVPRSGPAPLRLEFASATDGTATTQTATIANEYPIAFPQARVRLVLRRGTYQVVGGTVVQKFDADDGARTILDLEVHVAARSAVTLRVTPK